MLPHHAAWLSVHPNRSAAWLAEKIKDGFDVHHLDGDHENNDPSNLVLIEHADHMMLHGGRTLGRLKPYQRKKNGERKRPGRWVDLGDGNEIRLKSHEHAKTVLRMYDAGDFVLRLRAVPKAP